MPAAIAEERRGRLMEIQQQISAECNSAWVGRIVDVLIEQENPASGELIGRCLRFAPDVDGEVRIHPGSNGVSAAPGTMVPVRITAASVYDLEGEVVGIEAMLENEKNAARRS